MIFGNRRYSHTRAGVSILTLAVYLATMLPPRRAEADSAPSPFPAAGQGMGGAPSLAGPQPEAGSTESLASVDLSTGAATSSYPFQLPTARGSAQPSLSLTYSSSAGIGFAGIGWTLDTPSIERRGASGVPLYDNDVLGTNTNATTPATPIATHDKYVFNGEPLVPICTLTSTAPCADFGPEQFPASLIGYTYFRAEIDNGMRFFLSPNLQTWQVQTKTGVTMTFGVPGDTLVTSAPALEMSHDALATATSQPYRWNLSRQTDPMGNVVAYVWWRPEVNVAGGIDPNANQGREYLIDIYDTLAPGFAAATGAEASFAHHTHLNWNFQYQLNSLLALSPSWRTPQSMSLEGVDVTSSPIGGGPRQILRRYWLTYNTLDGMNQSTGVASNTQQFLSSIQLEGACGNKAEDQSNFQLPAATNCPMQPKLTMTYQAPVPAMNNPGCTLPGVCGPTPGVPAYFVDMNGDSIPDVIENPGVVNGYQVNGVTLTAATISDLYQPQPPGRYALGDWNGGGQLEWLWLNISSITTSSNTYEVYSAYDGVPATDGVDFTALSAPQKLAPPVSASGFSYDLNTQRAMDIDGDGYTDMAGVPGYTDYTNSNVSSFFTQRDVTGAIIPFGRPSPLSASTYCLNPLMWGQGAGYSHAIDHVVADVDGDGLADIVILENNLPYTPNSSFGEVTAHVYKNRGDGRFGLPDPSAPACAQNAYVPYDVKFLTGGGIDDYSFQLPTTTMHDVDGDGMADFLWVDSNGLWVELTRWETDGAGWFQGGDLLSAPAASALGCSTDGTTGHEYVPINDAVQFGDTYGTGVDDIYAYVCNNLNVFSLSGGVPGPPYGGPSQYGANRPGLLSSISNGLGVTTTLSYANIHDVATGGTIPVPGQVVTEVKTTNGLTGPYGSSIDTTYTYDSPVYDARDRQFIGFQNVTQHQLGSPSSPGLQTVTHFATGTCPNVSAAAPCPYAADYGWRIQRGLVAAVETSADGGGPQLTTTVNTYDYVTAYTGHDGRTVRRVFVAQTDEYLWDPTSRAALSAPINVLRAATGIPGPYAFSTTIGLPASNFGHRQHQYSVDSKGNPSWHLDLGLINRPTTTTPAQPADVPILTTTTWSTVPNDPTAWNWRPTQAYTTYANSSGTASGQARTLNFTYYPTGLLWTVSSSLTGTLPLALNEGSLPPDQSVEGSTITLATLNYNQWGDLTQIVRPGGQCTGFDYDTAYEQFLADTYQYTAGCGGASLTTSTVYDRGFEEITATVSPNGAMSTSTLDAFGRVTATYQNDPSAPQQTSGSATATADYSNFDTVGAVPVRVVKMQTLVGDNASYRTDYGYYDGFGRRLLNVGQTEVAQQWTVSGASQLDPSTGRAVSTWAPFFVSNMADGSTYNVQQAPACGSSCPSKSIAYDGFGRVTQVTDEQVGTQAARVTKISYSPATLSQTVQNSKQLANGASTVVVSDGHGRVVQRVDNLNTPADTIATTYTYLATGEVTQITRAHAAGGGDVRYMSYDTLGRRVSTWEPNSSYHQLLQTKFGTTTRVGQWVYAYNDAGQLVGTSDARGCGEVRQYDALGRVLGEDYHPCNAPNQPAYTYPTWSTGAGLESRFVYDTPEVVVTKPVVYKGSLTASYDRASHTQYTIDARGRTAGVSRQVAGPIGSTSEYTPHYFARSFTYDDANHIVGATTGADVAELMPGGSSSVVTQYNVRGGVNQVTMSYGTGQLLNSRTFGPSGEALTSVFGDASNVTQDKTYNPDGTLLRLHTHRNAGPWAAGTATYTPPAATDTAAIGELQDLNFTYDGALNPATVTDQATGAWPAGSLPVTRALTYDDLNRLTIVTIGYGSAGTATDAYNKPYQPEIANGDDSFPAPVAPSASQSHRPASQTFAYDFLGNITSSDDDLHISPDRSFGAATYGLGGTYATGDNQLRSTTQNGTTISATFDVAGNTTAVTVTHPTPCPGPCVTQYQYNWDEVGRLLSAERFEGTTSSTTTPKVTFQYLYTAKGERLLKQETNEALAGGGTVVSYDVNVFPSLRLQTDLMDGNGDYTRSESTETVFLQDGTGQNYGRALYPAGSVPSATGNAVHVYLELTNHLGSTSFIIDHDSGELVEATSDLTYGAVDSDTRSQRWNYFRADYRYTGHEDEAEVGLSYMGHRFYIPMLARFASPDPLSIHSAGGDLNPYAYVHGSPLAKVDLFGLCDSGPYCTPDGNNPTFGGLFAVPGAIAGFIGGYSTHPTAGGGGWKTPWTPTFYGKPLTNTPMVYEPAGPTLAQAGNGGGLTLGQFAAAGGAVVGLAVLIAGSILAPQIFAAIDETTAPWLVSVVVNTMRVAQVANTISLAEAGITVGVGGAVLLAEETAPTAAKLATGANRAVFWTGLGKGGDAVAAAWARLNNGDTLETTMAQRGVVLPDYGNGSNPVIVKMWNDASVAFAQGAQGAVRVLQGASVGVGRTWSTFEWGALIKNPNVTSITAIDPVTGLETLLWTR